MKSLRSLWRSREEPEVSVLIPAYMAETFIDRTLRFARGQTFNAIRILVSIDAGKDRTADVVRRHAELDSRVSYFEQRERLGWVGNVNFLLDRVATPFFFLYFHDDIIVPQYAATLLQVLRARPDAASVHCDLMHFGGSETSTRARAFEGTAVSRLLAFLLVPARGSPLRSLVRTSLAGHIRLPDNPAGGLWANEPFLLQWIAAGPALAVPELLYWRWDHRPGGITAAWGTLPPEETLRGHVANIASSMQLFAATTRNPEEIRALTFALFLNYVPRLRDLERHAGRRLFSDPSELHPQFADIRPPEDLGKFGQDFEAWASTRWQTVAGEDRGRSA